MEADSVIQNLQTSMIARLHQLADNAHVYWVSNNHPIRSKFAAMKNLAAGQATSFYFFDQQWSRADWSKPSSDSFDNLLIQRAKEIRQNYSYVRLAYSGGSDSHTALMAFRMAGVAPDEIYFWSMLGEYPSKFDNNFEINRSVRPYVPIIQQWFPKTKIRHINLDYNRYRALKLLHPSHSAFEISTGLRSLTTSFSLAAFEDFAIGSNVVTITGSDKPRLDRINGQWYAWLTDLSCMHNWGQGVEGFFASENPALYIKQCHTLKNFLTHLLPQATRRQLLKIQTHGTLQHQQELNQSIGRYQPFDIIAMSRKQMKRQFWLGERGIKSYCLWRTIRARDGGPEFLQQWQRIKQQFKTETGFCPTVEMFGKFYNLDTGEIRTVDSLFPNGWHLND